MERKIAELKRHVEQNSDYVGGDFARLAREMHDTWTALERDRATLPYRLAHLPGRLGRPLPALDDRPWPPDAPPAVKLWGALRHYGPLGLASELRAYARWRRRG